tara:strand:+ start:3652 stop:4668 length:1017 start_codon:yes stop_codon:yes gene_type:complete
MQAEAYQSAIRVIHESRKREGRYIVICLTLLMLLAGWSAVRLDLPESLMTGGSELVTAIRGDKSSGASGLSNFIRTAFPPALHIRVSQEYFSTSKAGWLKKFAYTETERTIEFDLDAPNRPIVGQRTVYVIPFGYLYSTTVKVLETFEMAAWGTGLAILIALPFAPLATSGFAPSSSVRTLARIFASFNRAVPELISAMLLVLIFGFGPLAGIIALGLHSSGFFIKFLADDIENSPPEPYRTLRSFGLSNWHVMRWAVVPHVFPQMVAYSQYILERNIRSAAILGIVGAGGIGMELKGRWDLGQFDHVTTLVFAIFICVVAMEILSNHFRSRIIDGPN